MVLKIIFFIFLLLLLFFVNSKKWIMVNVMKLIVCLACIIFPIIIAVEIDNYFICLGTIPFIIYGIIILKNFDEET